MNKYWIYIIIAISVSTCIGTQKLYAKGASSSSASTLLQPTSARIAALAGASSALSEDIVLLNYNPSGIFSIKEKTFSTMYQLGYVGDSYANIHYGQKLSSFVLASSLLCYYSGKISMYNTSGREIEKIGKLDLIYSLGMAGEVNNIPVGMNIKAIYSSIFGKSAIAFAGDFGVQYKIINDFSAGLSIRNLGTKLKYISAKEKLPTIIQGGLRYDYNISGSKLISLFDMAYHINEQYFYILPGFEYNVIDFLNLRVGYSCNCSGKQTKNLNIGIGLKSKEYSFDYAAGVLGDLSMPHRLSFTSYFGKSVRKKSFSKKKSQRNIYQTGSKTISKDKNILREYSDSDSTDKQGSILEKYNKPRKVQPGILEAY